ncbi:MAG: glycoside hydrolase family 3 C-terminal domain-containing protein [Clostridia bacterium]|nr:glycoside hydrolase family 3 C-terminal domain-containing protein [Clostridia bacterium]
MYKNPNLSPEERARDLLSKMTLDEKFEQMHINDQIMGAYEELMTTGKTGTFGGTFHSPKPGVMNKLQEYMVNETRLGIPLLCAVESLHGLSAPGATAFPQCAGLGGSFDKELVGEMADVIGFETRAYGLRQVYAPDVDVARDPRWGRTQESYGEDPYLNGVMGSEYVKGIQKHDVASTIKHYTGYGVGEGGLNLAPGHLGEREVREVMLEAFKMCVDAGAMSVMPAYNEIDGVPVHASKKYMRQILRDELGFSGVTVSDYGAIDMFHGFHNIAEKPVDAGRFALEAGIDIEAPFIFGYNDELKKDILDGKVDISLIDEAVFRILTLKFKLGLFENPYDIPQDLEKLHCDKAIEISKKLDLESILLLENDGILPLDEKKAGKVAVIGNNATDLFMGDYISKNDRCVSFYDGMVNRLGKENVLYARGTYSVHGTDEMRAHAVETAKKADTVFLVLGDSATVGGGANGGAGNDDSNLENSVLSGEAYDRSELTLTPNQQKLFDEVIALGKPTVLIIYGGRPYAIKNESDKANAYMFCWGGGEQNGNAFAELIFGDCSPSAKLSVSFPQSVGHIPAYYNHKPSSRGFYKKHGSPESPGRDYVLSSPAPLYPFGYGLSYTKLNYSRLKAEKTENGRICVSVTIENTGEYDIYESVLLYVRALYCPITPFVKRLRKFKKVHIGKGESVHVEFELDDNDFTYIDENMKTVVHHGKHRIMIENLTVEI